MLEEDPTLEEPRNAGPREDVRSLVRSLEYQGLRATEEEIENLLPQFIPRDIESNLQIKAQRLQKIRVIYLTKLSEADGLNYLNPNMTELPIPRKNEVLYQGETRTLKEWAKHLKLKYHTIYQRYRTGLALSLVFAKGALNPGPRKLQSRMKRKTGKNYTRVKPTTETCRE